MVAIDKPREESSDETYLLYLDLGCPRFGLEILGFQILAFLVASRTVRKKNFCYLIHLVYGIIICHGSLTYGMTEDEMVEWHHLLYGHEFEQAHGAGEGQGSLACCSQWGHSQT